MCLLKWREGVPRGHPWSRKLVDRSFVGQIPSRSGEDLYGKGKWTKQLTPEGHHRILWTQGVLEAELWCYRAIKREHLRWNSFWLPENTELDKELPSLVGLEWGLRMKTWKPGKAEGTDGLERMRCRLWKPQTQRRSHHLQNGGQEVPRENLSWT